MEFGRSSACRTRIASAAAAAVFACTAGLTGIAWADHVDPVVYGDEEGEENNPSCAFLNPDWNEVKVNKAPNGDHPDSDDGDNPGGEGPLVFTIKNSDGKVFDWSANMGVDAVIVKGGNRGSNVYLYDPEADSDERLRSPDNTQGETPAVSHVSACYDASEDEGDSEQQPGEQGQPEDPGEGGEEPQDDPDQPEGEQDEPGNERPADPDEPTDDEEGGGEGEAAPDDEETGDGDGGVKGVSETEQGDTDDVAEETDGSDDSDPDDDELPFTGAPISPLLLLSIALLFVGFAGRAGTRD